MADYNIDQTSLMVNPHPILCNDRITLTIEGDYDTVLQGVENALGTIWNNWQTDWVGEPVIERTTSGTVATTAPNFVAQEFWGQTGERQEPLSMGPGANAWWAPLQQ